MDTEKVTLFPDRTYAAFLLEKPLHQYQGSDSVIMAVPRGGVPIGYHLSKLLHLPLDLLMSKKIGHPANKEYAIGSVTPDEVILDKEAEGVSSRYIAEETKKIQQALASRYRRLAKSRKQARVDGKTVILVDDGLATGYTMLAGVKSLRKQNPSEIIVAVPVASRAAFNRLNEEADQVICLSIPSHFQAVGQFYQIFSEITDDEVERMLANHSNAGVSSH